MSNIPSDDIPSNKELFHSSEYAKQAFGKAIGSTSSETYDQRLRTHNNRKKIRSYRDSMIARVHDQRNRHRKDISPQQTSPVTPQGPSRSTQKQQDAAKQNPKSTPMKFQEPPSRGYDPYAR